MGVVAAAAITAAAGIGTAAYGSSQNKKAQAENARRENESKEDYAERLKEAAVWSKKLQDQYNKIVKKRPNLTWENYVRSQLKEVDDPLVREVYERMKTQDFEGLIRLADLASEKNTDRLIEAADDISGGQWQGMMDRRVSLINNTNAGEAFLRANELAAPVREDASTVKFDNQGRLIEGQRSDKATFQTAFEVRNAMDREQKEDIRTFQNDILNAAASQQEKASSFTGFYDPTAYANIIAAQQNAQEVGYQALDERNAWDMYNVFAKSAAGITPTQPSYVTANPGDAMIKAGVEMGTNALTDYYKNKSNQNNQTSTAKPYG